MQRPVSVHKAYHNKARIMKGVVKTVWPSDFAGKVINVLCTPVNGSAGDFHTHGLNAHIVCKENQFITLCNKDFWKKTQHTQACHIRNSEPQQQSSYLSCELNHNNGLVTWPVNDKNSHLTFPVNNMNSLILTCPVNWITPTVFIFHLWSTTTFLPVLWTPTTAFLPVLWTPTTVFLPVLWTTTTVFLPVLWTPTIAF